MLYLSPVYHTLMPHYRDRFGYMHNIAKLGAGVDAGIQAGHLWMLDNGAYANKFTPELWAQGMSKYIPWQHTCLGVVVPDVVGDWRATVTLFAQYAPLVQPGYPVAFVTQDGLQVDGTPWDALDVLFVGGTDEHKLHGAWALIAEAQRLNKRIHVGRVNSVERIERFWMADSVDGTMLAREPSMTRQRYILQAADAATAQREQRGQRGLFENTDDCLCGDDSRGLCGDDDCLGAHQLWPGAIQGGVAVEAAGTA